jgi:hypothetical protein
MFGLIRKIDGLVLVAAIALVGCTSQLTLSATPARPQIDLPVRAVLSQGAAGSLVTIDNPTLLPDAVRNAPSLKVVVGGRNVAVTRNPGGSYSFSLPPGTNTTLDVAGNLRVVFIMNDRDSQIVNLGTGSPIQFDTPPVATDPNPGFIVQGLDVKLHANTQADPAIYQFTWSFSSSAQGPWQPIPGQGKDVSWTPPLPGNYFVKVDAVDRTSQQSYSTITSSAVVFVTDTKEVLATDPPSGTVQRGNAITLKFNRPNGLRGTNLSYAWSAGPSPQGPWAVISGNGPTVSWLPTATGSSYIKAEVSDKDSGKVNTFISPNAIVFVTEGTPIITPSQTSVQRGDQVQLALNIANAGTGPFTWFYGVSGGPSVGGFGSPTWIAIANAGSAGKQISQIVNEAGSYNYRVDFPDANGNIQSFTTTNPVLNVHEGQAPLITSDPANAVIANGGTVQLKLNARGVDEINYRYTWYAATNPNFGWSALPVTSNNDPKLKVFTWATLVQQHFGNNTVNQTQAAGSYFIRVDATELHGTATYTFTSAAPVVTIQP